MASPGELKEMIDAALEGSRGPHKPRIMVGDVDVSSKRRAAMSAVSSLLGMADAYGEEEALPALAPTDSLPEPVLPAQVVPEIVEALTTPQEFVQPPVVPPPPPPPLPPPTPEMLAKLSAESVGGTSGLGGGNAPPSAPKSPDAGGGLAGKPAPIKVPTAPKQKIPSLQPDLIAAPKKPVVSAKTQGPAAPAAGTHERRVVTAAIDLILEKVSAYTPGLTFSPDKQHDLELWKAYKAAPSSMTLKPLMDNLAPLIRSEVNRWSGSVPRSVLEKEGKTLALEAIKTYKPNMGAALATHVMNRLRKLSRKTYMHQDLVRLPENKKLKSQTYHKGFQHLQGEHGRDPTNSEIADHLGWSRRFVSNVQRSMIGEYIESQDVGGETFSGDVTGRDSQDSILDMVYHDLAPPDKLIMEHTTGYSGKAVMTVKQLQPVTNLTANQINYRKRKIAARIQHHLK